MSSTLTQDMPRRLIAVISAVMFGASACTDEVPTQPSGDATPARAAVATYAAVDLGTLGGISSVARSISPSGAVVGWSETSTGERHAFLWSKGVMTDLGTLGGGLSEAYSINPRGDVVGQSLTAAGQLRAA